VDEVRAHYERQEVVAAYRSDGNLDAAETALVERYLVPGSRVLDVTCGAGRGTLALARRGFTATGADISGAMIGEARAAAARLGLAALFVVADAANLPFANASFDATVILCNGIGHLTRATMVQALGEANRVTTPGGAVIFSFRSPYALNRLLPRLLLRLVTRRGEHRDDEVSDGVYVHRPSVRTMTRLARDAGLEVVETATSRAATRGRRAGRLELLTGGQFFVVSRAGARPGVPRPSV
jgi:ubiquinone/menaquinone biosynthesis C-methylase UbiE